MTRTKVSAFFLIPPQSNPSLKEPTSSVNSLITVLKKVNFMMLGNLLHATVQMGVLRLKPLVLINNIVQWHMLNNSESTLLSWI